MPDVEHLCPCGVTFIGRPNQKYHDEKCRWTHNVYKARGKDVSKREPNGPIDYAKQGKANRAKGARAEREVCHLLTELTGHKVTRNLSQTRDAGSDVEWGPFLLEVKYQKTLALPQWQRQVRVAVQGTDKVPAVVYRRPEEDWWVSLPFPVFVMLFETLRKAAQAAVDSERKGD